MVKVKNERNERNEKIAKNKINEVPKHMTLNEAAEFWEAHSFLDYDDIEEVHFSVDLRRNRNYIDIKEDLAKQIRLMARQKRISPRSLVNQWLREKIVTEQNNEG